MKYCQTIKHLDMEKEALQVSRVFWTAHVHVDQEGCWNVTYSGEAQQQRKASIKTISKDAQPAPAGSTQQANAQKENMEQSYAASRKGSMYAPSSLMSCCTSRSHELTTRA